MKYIEAYLLTNCKEVYYTLRFIIGLLSGALYAGLLMFGAWVLVSAVARSL